MVRTAGPRLPPGPAVVLTRFCQLLLLRPCPECGRNRSVRTCPERQDSPCHAGPRRELIARAVSSRQQTGPQSPWEETSVPRPPRRGCARRWWGRARGRGSGAAPAWAGPVRAGSHPPPSLPRLLTVTLPPLLLFSRTAARPSRGRGHPWPQGLLCRGLHGLSTPLLLRWTRGPQEGRSNPRSFTHGLIWGKRSLQSDKAENLEVRPPWILLVGFASNDRCVPSKERKRRATDAGDALGRDRGRSGMTTGQGAPGVSGSSTAFQPRGAADGPTDAIGTPGRAE